MHERRPLPCRVEHLAQTVTDLRPLDRAQRAVARGGRQPPLEHGGQSRLVDLHDDLGAGHEALDVGDVRTQALRERPDEVAPRTVVGDGALAARELDRRTERPRPGDLDLERAGPAVVGLGELVEVLAQEGAGPPFVMAGTAREAPPVGLGLDVQSLEQARRAPDHVGPDPTTGQLGQVRDAVAEQVADGDDGLA